jgi:Ca-activated chloride channel family protein
LLLAFGRYSGHGAAAVKITGTLSGQNETFVTDVHFAEQDTSSAFIPRLWATRRVGYLLDEIRMHGESKELKDEVTRLAREHGIVTPYTAFLILEDEKSRHVPVALQNFRELDRDDRVRGEAGRRFEQAAQEARDPSARTGAKAVDAAKDVAALKQSENLDQTAAAQPQGPPTINDFLKKSNSTEAWAYGAGSAGPQAQFGTTQTKGGNYGYRVAQNYAQQARVLNGRAFYQNGNTWTDNTAQLRPNLKQQKIAFNSDEYFDLLKKHPEAAAWLALGTEVDVVLDDTLYIVR